MDNYEQLTFEKCIFLAESGDHEAQYELSIRYKYGNGGAEKDWRKADTWFRKAEQNGNAEAEYRLG